MDADPRKDFVVSFAPGFRLKGQGNENVELEENGSVLKVRGVLMHDLGFFTFYTPTPIALPENKIRSVTRSGVKIFPH